MTVPQALQGFVMIGWLNTGGAAIC